MAIPIIQQIRNRLGCHACFYVTRDIERALGIVPDASLPYFIITNATDYAKEVASKKPNILLLENESVLDTWQLLEYPETKKRIRPDDFIIVFKNTALIESICKKNSWRLLNPSAKLANKVEEKISQVNWLGELAKYLPPHEILTAKKIRWNNKKFILQFNRAHTGGGTVLIENEPQLNELKAKFPHREVRVTEFVNGPVFTSNNVVHSSGVLVGNISYQITGIKPFTGLPFATIGNDWALPNKLLAPEQKNYFAQIVADIGKKLRQDGWRGLFGVDIIMDEQAGKLYLLEINARQPASTTYESALQKKYSEGSSDNMTTFEAHLASLLGFDLSEYRLTQICDGAQIIQRVISDKQLAIDQNGLTADGFNLIKYASTKPGSDLLRIQSASAIMAGHGQFNNKGGEIINRIELL